jgi:hypothetical protein
MKEIERIDRDIWNCETVYYLGGYGKSGLKSRG